MLTEKRNELLDRLREGEVKSVRDLARQLERDKSSVSRDLSLLAQHDLIEYQHDGSRKIPSIKHETVIIEPIV